MVDEFNEETMRIYHDCYSPIFIMVLNMSLAKEAENYINVLRRLGPKYSEYFLFAYASAEDKFIEKRKLMPKRVPGGTITFRDGSAVPYPENWPFDDNTVDHFLEAVIRQKMDKSESPSLQPDLTKDVYKELTAVKLLKRVDFNHTILESGKNVLIFFFSSLNETYEYVAH